MQWALAGVAAFTAVGLAVDHGWSFVPGLVVGALCAGVVAVIIGVPALRLRGVTLVIVTLAASITLQQLVFNQFGGGAGYVAPVASLFGLHLIGRTFSVLALILLAVLCIATYALRRSTVGKRLLAIRASERAAAASGVRTVFMKTAVFGLGGVLAGVGGVVWGYATGAVQAGSFDPITALEIVAFLYINGVGSIGAGVMAGFAIAMGQPFLTNIVHVNGSAVFDIIAGVGLIYTLIMHPDGALVHRKRQGPRTGLIARGTELLGRTRGGVPEPTVTGALLVRTSRQEDRAEG
jgi:branched-chain amino acid transport system permease protein